MMKIEPANRRHAAIWRQFYAAITGIHVVKLSEIPTDVRVFMSGLEYHEMVRPMVIKDLRNGVAISVIADVYGLTRQTVYRIGKKYGCEEIWREKRFVAEG